MDAPANGAEADAEDRGRLPKLNEMGAAATDFHQTHQLLVDQGAGDFVMVPAPNRTDAAISLAVMRTGGAFGSATALPPKP